MKKKKNTVAVWAVTPNGEKLGSKIAKNLPDAVLYVSSGLKLSLSVHHEKFNSLSSSVIDRFNIYQGHIFIMSTGIVVRIIASLIRHKTVDPAVVVVDEMGTYAISLLSGHIGGANRLAEKISKIIGATCVITTATDLNKVPAIDLLSVERDLVIENLDAIKYINMAFLTGKKICLHDPYNLIEDRIINNIRVQADAADLWADDCTGVFVDDILADLPPRVLKLRPKTLAAGIGCNRNTSMEEIKNFLLDVLERFDLSIMSLKSVATADVKANEPGLLALSENMGLPLEFFDKKDLNSVEIITPSAMAKKYLGVKSVCEAAAILSAQKGTLIVPKQSNRNVTVAIARILFSS